MSGYKNTGQVQGSSMRGELLPSQSHINFAVPPGGGGTPPGYGGVCSCGSETPTLNIKGKLLVKSRPLFRDTNHYLVLFPYTLH